MRVRTCDGPCACATCPASCRLVSQCMRHRLNAPHYMAYGTRRCTSKFPPAPVNIAKLGSRGGGGPGPGHGFVIPVHALRFARPSMTLASKPWPSSNCKLEQSTMVQSTSMSRAWESMGGRSDRLDKRRVNSSLGSRRATMLGSRLKPARTGARARPTGV